MPRILGLEPEALHKAKPLLFIAGGGLILYLVVKGRSGAPVAAEAPSGGPVQGVSSPAAQPELSAGQQTANALQGQLQAQQGQLDIAAQALGLQSQQHQQQFQAQQDAFTLQREGTVAAQQDAITHEQFKQLKKKGQTGGFLGGVMNFINQAAQDVSAFTGAVNTASQAAQAVNNFGVPTPRGNVQGSQPNTTQNYPPQLDRPAAGQPVSLSPKF